MYNVYLTETASTAEPQILFTQMNNTLICIRAG